MRGRMTGVAALGAAATLALGGCSSFSSSSADNEYCVDENDQVVDNIYCDDDSYGDSFGGVGHTYYYVRGPYAKNLVRGSALDVTKAKSRRLMASPQSALGATRSGDGTQRGSATGSTDTRADGTTRRNSGGFGSSESSSNSSKSRSGSSSNGG
ncbi:hypothetical protein [Williamsia sp. CHRR-6]|uniref:hypothetical protein n=1 Tax=Williamsia sp. CHRR-6 TaxID=2835871 RepID=UPI001BDA37C5|nr:hypothetical protein [Williamsia sp. CHRR-6]MBT0567341.1 hypothetical protein [Williamsia sp. CHRR-6]